METKDTLVYVCIMVIGIILFPIIQSNISETNMGAWTFSGHEGVASFLSAFPYLFLLSMILVPSYLIIKEVKG